MHYSKTAFNIGSEPTIVTKIPQFMDVIGQRMGFSESDLTKLNRLYNCSESISTRPSDNKSDGLPSWLCVPSPAGLKFPSVTTLHGCQKILHYKLNCNKSGTISDL